jgi:hypothetical protein
LGSDLAIILLGVALGLTVERRLELTVTIEKYLIKLVKKIFKENENDI